MNLTQFTYHLAMNRLLRAALVPVVLLLISGCVPISPEAIRSAMLTATPQADAAANDASDTGAMDEATSSATATITTPNAPLRLAPADNSPVLAELAIDAEYPVSGISTSGLWVRLDVPESTRQSGWVAARFVSVLGDISGIPTTDETGDIAALATPAPDGAVVRTDGVRLRVRSAPEGTSEIIDYVYDGESVPVLGLTPDGAWALIDPPGSLEGGWVSAQFLELGANYTDEFAAAPEASAPTTAPEPTAEATPEPTTEAASEATPEPTAVPAAEAAEGAGQDTETEAAPEPTAAPAAEASAATETPTAEAVEGAEQDAASEVAPEPTEVSAEEATPETVAEPTAAPTEEAPSAADSTAEATPIPADEPTPTPAPDGNTGDNSDGPDLSGYPTPAAGEAVIVTNGARLRARSQPSIDGTITGYVFDGEVYEILAVSDDGEWLQIELESGEAGWIVDVFTLTADGLRDE